MSDVIAWISNSITVFRLILRNADYSKITLFIIYFWLIVLFSCFHVVFPGTLKPDWICSAPNIFCCFFVIVVFYEDFWVTGHQGILSLRIFSCHCSPSQSRILGHRREVSQSVVGVKPITPDYSAVITELCAFDFIGSFSTEVLWNID